jgi:hypothetical protein
LVFLVFLVFGWTLVAIVLALPVIYIVLLHVLRQADDSACIDLWNYGLVKEHREMCGEVLDIFYKRIFVSSLSKRLVLLPFRIFLFRRTTTSWCATALPLLQQFLLLYFW